MDDDFVSGDIRVIGNAGERRLVGICMGRNLRYLDRMVILTTLGAAETALNRGRFQYYQPHFEGQTVRTTRFLDPVANQDETAWLSPLFEWIGETVRSPWSMSIRNNLNTFEIAFSFDELTDAVMCALSHL